MCILYYLFHDIDFLMSTFKTYISMYTVCPTDLGPTLETILGMLVVMNIDARTYS